MKFSHYFSFINNASSYESYKEKFVELSSGYCLEIPQIFDIPYRLSIGEKSYTLTFWATIKFKQNEAGDLEYVKHRFEIHASNFDTQKPRAGIIQNDEANFVEFVKSKYLSFFKKKTSFIDESNKYWKYSKKIESIILDGVKYIDEIFQDDAFINLINYEKADCSNRNEYELANLNCVWKNYNIAKKAQILNNDLTVGNLVKTNLQKI